MMKVYENEFNVFDLYCYIVVDYLYIRDKKGKTIALFVDHSKSFHRFLPKNI